MSVVIFRKDDGCIAVIDDNEVLQVTNFIDQWGEDCEFDDAVVCVAGPDANGKWVTIDIEPGFERLN